MKFYTNEVMEGTHDFEYEVMSKSSRPMWFDVNWGADSVKDFLNPFGDKFLTAKLNGYITVDGLCDRAECKGILALRYFADAKIIYNFTFSVNGIEYRFIGQKVNIKPWNILTSHTTCFGTLKEMYSDKLISTSTTFFKCRNILSLLTSFRIKL